jgi:hypothetical protein
VNPWPTWLRRLLSLGIGDAGEADPVAEFLTREAEDDRTRFHAQMRAGGYRHWLDTPPVGRDVVECQREEWSRGPWRGPWVIRPAECDPLMNVADLWWRDVGGVVDVEPLTESAAILETGFPTQGNRNDVRRSAGRYLGPMDDQGLPATDPSQGRAGSPAGEPDRGPVVGKARG